jgi:hypothetical protein
VHHKARHLLKDQIHSQKIQFLDTPANSPNLNPIKHLHKDQKDELTDYHIKIASAARATQLEAEGEMQRV